MMHRVSAYLLARLPVAVGRTLVHGNDIASASQKPADGSRQLLVDISEIITRDASSGIQRVVRGMLLQLLTESPAGYQVKPVFAERHQGYRYAPVNTVCLQADDAQRASAQQAIVSPGDIFLGLDLAAHLLPRHQGQLLHWKRSGVRICVLVYDLLPLLHPHWFKPVRYKTFSKWLKTLAIYADDLFCISETVRGELCHMLASRYGLPCGVPRLHTIPLGADLEATMPSSGCTKEERNMLEHLLNREFVLMVGTVEPRKGYAEALGAFEQLWSGGEQTALVIVGKPGWKTEALQEGLRSHAERHGRLYWFEQATDELLQDLYKGAKWVLLASEAEGFGLPLVEALRHGKAVMARDIPVYREVGGENVVYFEHGLLAESMKRFLTAPPSVKPEDFVDVCFTWHESARQLSNCIVTL